MMTGEGRKKENERKNRKERRRLAKKIRADLQLEKNKIKKEKADSLESADDGRKSV